MPEVTVNGSIIRAAPGALLLDLLQGAGMPVSASCRAGHCQTCLVRSDSASIPALARNGLNPAQQQAGWLLSCQCPVADDLRIELLDPSRDATPATVHSVKWLSGSVIRLRLIAQRPIRLRAAQHCTLWLSQGVGRPYSIASLPSDPWLEFHIRMHTRGEFSAAAARLSPGQTLHMGIPAGHMHYDREWHDRPLLLLGQGTGLAPLYGLVRDALACGHRQPIELWHWHYDADDGCYLGDSLLELATAYPTLQVRLHPLSRLSVDLGELRPTSRRTVALVAGSPSFVEQWRKPLFMAGLPGRQILDEAFASGKA